MDSSSQRLRRSFSSQSPPTEKVFHLPRLTPAPSSSRNPSPLTRRSLSDLGRWGSGRELVSGRSSPKIINSALICELTSAKLAAVTLKKKVSVSKLVSDDVRGGSANTKLIFNNCRASSASFIASRTKNEDLTHFDSSRHRLFSIGRAESFPGSNTSSDTVREDTPYFKNSKDVLCRTKFYPVNGHSDVINSAKSDNADTLSTVDEFSCPDSQLPKDFPENADDVNFYDNGVRVNYNQGNEKVEEGVDSNVSKRQKVRVTFREIPERFEPRKFRRRKPSVEHSREIKSVLKKKKEVDKNKKNIEEKLKEEVAESNCEKESNGNDEIAKYEEPVPERITPDETTSSEVEDLQKGENEAKQNDGTTGSISSILSLLRCNNPPTEDSSSPTDSQFLGAQKARILLSSATPPVKDFVRGGGVTLLLDCLKRQHCSLPIQLEACWALTNIAAGDSEDTRTITANGGIELLSNLLSSTDPRVVDQAVWALGNIAGDSPDLRDEIVSSGALKKLLSLVYKTTLTRSRGCLAWTICNLLSHLPFSRFSRPEVRRCAEASAVLLRTMNMSTRISSAWSLVHFSSTERDDSTEEDTVTSTAKRIGDHATGGSGHTEHHDEDLPSAESEFGHQVSPLLVHCLSSQDVKLMLPAAIALSNLVRNNYVKPGHLVAVGVMPRLVTSLPTSSPESSLTKAILQLLHQLTIHQQNIIQIAFDHGIYNSVVNLMVPFDDSFHLKNQTDASAALCQAEALLTAASHCSQDTRSALLSIDMIGALLDNSMETMIWDLPHRRLLLIRLRAIEALLKSQDTSILLQQIHKHKVKEKLTNIRNRFSSSDCLEEVSSAIIRVEEILHQSNHHIKQVKEKNLNGML